MGDRIPFDFGSPWYLLLAASLPLAWWLARKSHSGLSDRRRIVSVILRLIVLLLLVLAISELRILKRNDRLAVIFVADRSESVPAEQREAARQYILERAQERDRSQEDLVGVVAFGRIAGIEATPRKDPLELESFVTLIEPDATDMAAAIRLAVAAFPEGTGKRIVLLSDGNENKGSVLEEARAARSRGVTIDVIPITYTYPSEVSVEKLIVDPEVSVGQPFNVRVVVESAKEVDAYVRLFENQRMVTDAGAKTKLRPGKNVFDFQRRFELAGKYDYEARVEPVNPEDDSILQNNAANGFTFIEGEPKVLLCTPEPELERPLVNALQAEKIAVKEMVPDSLPRAIEEYFEYQAIILSNVGAHELSEEKMLIFEALVKTLGIGFIMIGGENSFGAGGYQGTPVERLLPVEMEIKQRKVLPNGALAMVVHSCELSNGNYWANQVIQQSIRILSPRDYAGVLYFDNTGQDRWLFPMTPVSQRQMMISRLNGFNPGDMPSFQSIVTMAYQGLSTTPASIKHMIILSDGDPVMPNAQTINAIKAARITISTICYGSHGGIPPGMQQLAQQAGGKFYFLQSPRNLPEIFIREATTVQKSLISEEAFVPILAARGAFLQGVDGNSLPRLDGYVITSPKELASLNLLHPPMAGDPTQDPVLASWSYGLGKSIAFTSDAGRRWGKAWAAWGGFQRFWSQAVRWVSRPRNDERFRVTRSLDGEKASISLDAITPGGQFVNGLQITGGMTGPDFETHAVPVRQVSPGRYVAEFPAAKRGTYTLSLSHETKGVKSIYVTGLSVPYSAEYRRLSTNQELLRQVAEAGGGKYFSDPAAAEPFARDFPITRDIQDVWHACTLLAVFLFFVDVFVRRVVVDYRKAFASAVKRTFGWIMRKRAEPTASDERLATLLERKAEVRVAREARYQPGAPASSGGATSGAERSVAPADSTDAGAMLEAKPDPPPAAAKQEPHGKETPQEETSYTSRLLEAKKRALNRERKDKE